MYRDGGRSGEAKKTARSLARHLVVLLLVLEESSSSKKVSEIAAKVSSRPRVESYLLRPSQMARERQAK